MPMVKARAITAKLASGPTWTRSSVSSLTAYQAEHDRDRLVEVAEAHDQPLDQHEQRTQAEQREHVAHPDDVRVAG